MITDQGGPPSKSFETASVIITNISRFSSGHNQIKIILRRAKIIAFLCIKYILFIYYYYYYFYNVLVDRLRSESIYTYIIWTQTFHFI